MLNKQHYNNSTKRGLLFYNWMRRECFWQYTTCLTARHMLARKTGSAELNNSGDFGKMNGHVKKSKGRRQTC